MATDILHNESLDQTLRSEAAEAVASLDSRLAREIIARLKALGASPESAAVPAQAELYRAMWLVRLVQISDDDCVWLFNQALLEGLRLPGFDLEAVLGYRLDAMPDHEDRIALLEKLEQAMHQSSEQLGTADITIDKQSLSPTVSNWLQDFTYFAAAAGGGGDVGNLMVVNFLNQSPNVRALSEEDRAVLTRLLTLYENMVFVVEEYRSAPEFAEVDLPAFSVDVALAGADEFDSVEQAMTMRKRMLDGPPFVAPPATTPASAPEPAQPTASAVKPTQPQREPLRSEAVPTVQDLAEAPLGANLNVQGALANMQEREDAHNGLAVSGSKTVTLPPATKPPASLPKPTLPSRANAPVLPAAQPQRQLAVPKGSAGAVRPQIAAKPGAQLPPLAAPPLKTAFRPPPARLDSLDMDRIKREAEQKRGKVQADIDKRLQDLKGSGSDSHG